MNTENSMSDHNIIEFSINTQETYTNEEYRNIRKTRWTEYLEHLGWQLGKKQIEEVEEVDELEEHIRKSIKKAYYSSCSTTVKKTKFKVKWWTQELENKKREAGRLKNEYRRRPSEETRIERNRARKEYKDEIRKTREKDWRKFCDELEEASAIARIQRLMKDGRVQQIGTLQRRDGTYTDTPAETLQELMDVLFPEIERNEEVANVENYGNRNRRLTEIEIDKIINETTVKAAIEEMAPYKAAGTDGIRPIHLKKGLGLLLPFITKLYKKSLETGRPPKQWLEINAVFIPKPGKPDYKTAKSFRPISLSSYLLKGMEKTIHWHLKDTTLITEPINEEVYSYKEGVSTENALHKVTYQIEKALSKNRYALAVFLDISGAFSNAKISEMIKDLEDRGVEKQVVKWIGSILSERNITTTLAGAAISKKATRGTPEGAKLSPPIWNMKGSKAVDKFPKEERVDCTGFADDFNLLTIGSNPRLLMIDMQWGLIKLEQWAKENSLEFNASKTKAIMFTRKHNFEPVPLYLNGERIEYVESFKYLGVIFDRKLTWKIHIKTQIKKS